MAVASLRLGTSDSFFLDRLAGDLCHRRHHRLADQPDKSPPPASGIPSSAASSAFPWRSCRRSVPTAGVSAASENSHLRASLVDQQAALFGHGCRQPGQAKITFGTGAFALCRLRTATWSRPKAAGMNRSIAWHLGGRPQAYALEGGIYNAASAVNWARGLGLFADFAEIDELRLPRRPWNAALYSCRRFRASPPLLGSQRRGALARHGAGDEPGPI